MNYGGKMIDKKQIQNMLRVYGGKEIEMMTLPEDFYICAKEFKENYYSIWGGFKQFAKDEITHSRGPLKKAIKNAIKVHFPANCPGSWLEQGVQNSEFIVMYIGATTPRGYYSTLKGVKNLEQAIEIMESSKEKLQPAENYGIHAMYLGKQLK